MWFLISLLLFCVWQQTPVTCQMNVGDFCAAPYVDCNSVGYYRARIAKRRNQKVEVGLSALLLRTVHILFDIDCVLWQYYVHMLQQFNAYVCRFCVWLLDNCCNVNYNGKMQRVWHLVFLVPKIIKINSFVSELQWDKVFTVFETQCICILCNMLWKFVLF